jgi:hypothetical protein
MIHNIDLKKINKIINNLTYQMILVKFKMNLMRNLNIK